MKLLRAWAAGAILWAGCGAGGEAPRIVDAGASLQTVSVTVSGPGEVRPAQAGGTCEASEGASCSLALPQGSSLSLVATPKVGADFSGWTGACSGTGACLVAAGASVAAVFAPAPECAGLVPAALPPPVTVPQPQGFSAGCGGGTSDGAGNFVLGFTVAGVTTSPADAFFDARGAEIGQRNYGSDQGFVRFFGQPSGFTRLSTNETAGARELSSWSHQGTLTASTLLTSSKDPRPSYAAVAAHPAGGTVAAISHKSATTGWVNRIDRYDAQGNLVSSAPVDGAETKTVAAVGVDGAGDALVFAEDGGAWVARWFDGAGAPLTAWFPAAATNEVRTLADGTLVAYSGRPAVAVALYRAGAAAPEPLPQWLQERAGNRLFAVHGGYAAWGPGGSCGGSLELLSASGRACGCVHVPALDPYASVGRDGSLIVAAQEGATCHYELYPQLLK